MERTTRRGVVSHRQHSEGRGYTVLTAKKAIMAKKLAEKRATAKRILASRTMAKRRKAMVAKRLASRRHGLLSGNISNAGMQFKKWALDQYVRELVNHCDATDSMKFTRDVFNEMIKKVEASTKYSDENKREFIGILNGFNSNNRFNDFFKALKDGDLKTAMEIRKELETSTVTECGMFECGVFEDDEINIDNNSSDTANSELKDSDIQVSSEVKVEVNPELEKLVQEDDSSEANAAEEGTVVSGLFNKDKKATEKYKKGNTYKYSSSEFWYNGKKLKNEIYFKVTITDSEFNNGSFPYYEVGLKGEIYMKKLFKDTKLGNVYATGKAELNHKLDHPDNATLNNLCNYAYGKANTELSKQFHYLCRGQGDINRYTKEDLDDIRYKIVSKYKKKIK